VSVLRCALAALAVAVQAGCSGQTTAVLPMSPSSSSTGTPPAIRQPVYVVVFTHIEDNTPAGALSAPATRMAYLGARSALIDMAERARRHSVPWSLQPDWKLLEAALLYEDAAAMASTGGVNVFRYLRDTLGVAVDPHSHEGGGYNYTDVAHLLDLLGVGGSTVIGGHVWDPALPQFQQWDRFRLPVSGNRYPAASWRGDILMGSGTPNHVNDPIVSGVWRPRDRTRYFEDDPAGNIAAVGAYKSDLTGIGELVSVYASGRAPSTCMLTASYGIRPADFLAPGTAAAVESAVLAPLASLRASGDVELTSFTALVATWRQRYGGRACTFDGQRIAAATGPAGAK
jgi:hypothetical protein